MCVFGEKTVSRVYGIDISYFCRTYDAINAEIAFACRGFTDTDRLVRQLHMHGIRVRLRINRYRANIQFLARTNDADSNFPAISYQEFLKHDGISPAQGRSLNNGWPNSTGLAFSTNTWVIVPLASALISFMTFMASMMQTTVSGLTSVPTST